MVKSTILIAGVAPRQFSSLLYSRVLQLTPKGLSAHLVVRSELSEIVIRFVLSEEQDPTELEMEAAA